MKQIRLLNSNFSTIQEIFSSSTFNYNSFTFFVQSSVANNLVVQGSITGLNWTNIPVYQLVLGQLINRGVGALVYAANINYLVQCSGYNYIRVLQTIATSTILDPLITFNNYSYFEYIINNTSATLPVANTTLANNAQARPIQGRVLTPTNLPTATSGVGQIPSMSPKGALITESYKSTYKAFAGGLEDQNLTSFQGTSQGTSATIHAQNTNYASATAGNLLILRGGTNRVVINEINCGWMPNNADFVMGLKVVKQILTGTPTLVNGTLRTPAAISGSSTSTSSLWVASSNNGVTLSGLSIVGGGVLKSKVLRTRADNANHSGAEQSCFMELKQPIVLENATEYLIVSMYVAGGSVRFPHASVIWSEY
jgi:hypothetical protein